MWTWRKCVTYVLIYNTYHVRILNSVVHKVSYKLFNVTDTPNVRQGQMILVTNIINNDILFLITLSIEIEMWTINGSHLNN